MFLDRLVDNIQDIPPFSLYYLGLILNNKLATPPNFLTRYEINRLNYTHIGGFDKMDDRKKQMMVITIIVMRVYVPYLLKVWEPFPEGVTPKKDEVKRNTLLQENMWNICSGINEIVMEYLRGLVPVQHNNQDHLAQDYKISERLKGYISIPDYRELDENKDDLNDFYLGRSDELVLYPMIPGDLIEAFHVDVQFKNSMMAMLEGWATQVVDIMNS